MSSRFSLLVVVSVPCLLLSLVSAESQQPRIVQKEKKEEGKPAVPRGVQVKPVQVVNAKPKGKSIKELPHIDKINAVIDFSGLDDPRMKFIEVLDQWSKLYGITWIVDETAFRNAMLLDVKSQEIANPHPIGPTKLPARLVLKQILARINIEGGAGFLVRNDHILITTNAAIHQEVGSQKPLVTLGCKKEPLKEVLNQLGDLAQASIILDPSVVKKYGCKPVSMRLFNVPEETAVRVVAEMVGLTMVRLDNVLFVTTLENAKKLAKEKKADNTMILSTR